MSLRIDHDPGSHRFATQVDGYEAELIYRQQGARLIIEPVRHNPAPAAQAPIAPKW